MDIYLGTGLLGETIYLRKHLISPVTGDSVWNIKLFFVYSFIITKFANLFSLSCALLCFSSNYFVLRIAKYIEYISEKPIPLAGMYKAWVCVRSLSGIWVGVPSRAWMSVSCECCLLPDVVLRVCSLVRKILTSV